MVKNKPESISGKYFTEPKRKEFRDVSIFIFAQSETVYLKKTVDVILETCNHKDIREIVIVLNREFVTAQCLETVKEIISYNIDVEIKMYYQHRPTLGGAIIDSFEIMQGSHWLVLEADFGTNPYAVKEMIEKSKENPEKIVTGSRWIKGGGFKDYGDKKVFINHAFQKIVGIMYLSKLTDFSFPYQIMPKEVVENINWGEPRRNIVIEMSLKPLRAGYKFVEVPVKWEGRNEGYSTQKFRKNFHYFNMAVRIRFMKKKDLIK